jgi:hypothetical protein
MAAIIHDHVLLHQVLSDHLSDHPLLHVHRGNALDKY